MGRLFEEKITKMKFTSSQWSLTVTTLLLVDDFSAATATRAKCSTACRAESWTAGNSRRRFPTENRVFDTALRRFHRAPRALNTLAKRFVSGSPSLGGS
jgi:hypothetical protein